MNTHYLLHQYQNLLRQVCSAVVTTCKAFEFRRTDFKQSFQKTYTKLSFKDLQICYVIL